MQVASQFFLGEPNDPKTHLSYAVDTERLDPPKYSPKKFGTDDPQPFEFDWIAAGYVRLPERQIYNLRFRVYSQERKAQGDRQPMVTRMLLRMWDILSRDYQSDHSMLYNGGIVDVYLCWGGTPGGEQRFDVDIDGKPPRERKVDTIYIYDLSSFTDPIEMAREVAHEYGHAVLAPVGGFVTPEDWANGQLGEKLFLRRLRDQLAAGQIDSADVMGATVKGLDQWLAKNSDPLILNIAANGPLFSLMDGQGQPSMDCFTGLVAYADVILPHDVVGLSLKLIGSQKAKDYPPALVEACKEKQRVVLSIPPLLAGKNLWVPLADGKVTGAQVVKRQDDWAEIKPGGLIAVTLVY